MQVRKFEAPTMNEALQIIKQELGPDAIILSTKNHRKGFGLLSKASVEVTAAVSEKNLTKKQITEKVVSQQSKEQIRNLPAKKQAEVYDGFNEYYVDKAQKAVADKKGREQLDNLRSKVNSRGGRYIDITDEEEKGAAANKNAYGRNGRSASSAPAASAPAAANRTQVPSQQASASFNNYGQSMSQQDMEDLLTGNDQVERVGYAPPKSATQRLRESNNEVEEEAVPINDDRQVQSIREDVRRLKMMLEELKNEQTALADSRIVESGSDEINNEFQNLLRNGIDRKYAAQLLKHIASTMRRDDLQNNAKIVEAVAMEMMSNIRVENIIDFQSGDQQRVCAIVGPTGVGKTTTIAKIAAQAILQKNLRVGLINVDSYKIAASDQLATYSKILNVPFRQATNTQELERALAEFRPLDLVLIDTSGRSQKDSESLVAMKQLLDAVTGLRTFLITSATTRDQELYDILNRFRIFNPNGLVFSKLDETSIFGCIYNMAVKTGLPLTYFGVGQRVPEDIEVSSKERVIDLILDL